MRSSSAQRQRSRLGNAAEGLVEQHNELLAAAGIAWIYRVPTPVRFMRNGGRLEAVHVKRATVDYLGHDTAGRVIAVESKRIAGRTLAGGQPATPTLPLSRIEPHQRACLERVYLAGGVAVVVVVNASGELFSVPWSVVRACDASVRDLRPYRVAPGRTYLRLPDSPPASGYRFPHILTRFRMRRLPVLREADAQTKEPVSYDMRRSRRKHPTRASSSSSTRYTKANLERERAIYRTNLLLLGGEHPERPKTRADCGPRPGRCPFTSCKYHLAVDVSPRTGAIKQNFPDLDPAALPVSCALDVADKGGATLEDVGAIMNLTRERVRQLEVMALQKLVARGGVEVLREFAGWLDDGRPVLTGPRTSGHTGKPRKPEAAE